MVEIAPNTWMRYRGVEETKACVKRGYFREGVECWWCPENDMLCILDADFVICPLCQVASPTKSMGHVECCANDIFSTPMAKSHGGVALGFTWVEVVRWLSET